MTSEQLPKPRTLSRGDEDGAIQLGYTADQMHAFRAAGVAQAVEACAQVVADFPHWLGAQGKAELAAAIRATIPRTEEQA